jgi:hypothetical protein
MLLGLALCLFGCDPGGNQGSLSTPDSPSAPSEQQAIQRLLELYHEAVLAEDIDRLQALLQPTPALAQAAAQGTPRQATDGTFADLATFRQALSATFVTQAVTALEIPAAEVRIAPDRGSITFLEVESTLDTVSPTQATRVFRPTWQLARTEANGVVTFRIAAVTRPAPLVEVHTPGLLLAGPPAPVEVHAASAAFALAAADLTEPVTGASQHLTATAGQVHGTFLAAADPAVSSLGIRAVGSDGTELVFTHHYRLHQAREGIAQRLAGTGTTRFLAVTVAPDGTVWAGGDGGGRLYQVAPASTTAEFVGALLDDPAGRVEEVLIDAQGRLHVVVVGPQRAGVIVREADGFCQTVNVLDPAYPLLDGAERPSPSTRAVAGADGGLVLAGSDGGVVAVRETFPPGQCAVSGGAVVYAPALRRQTSALPTNTVPALVVSQDGALWLGTALGLTRLHNGQFTRVPFEPALSFQGDAATLEAFFRQVAEAIFAVRPLETVALGDVSFVEAFGQPLSKEDLVFSLAENPQGTLWVGTLGGRAAAGRGAGRRTARHAASDTPGRPGE